MRWLNCASLLLTSCVAATHGQDDAIKQILQEVNFTLPGIAVGVVRDGDVLYAQGFGQSAYGGFPDGDRVDQDMLFEIGSNTKSFIAVGLAYFVDRGRISFDTLVKDVIPGFRGPSPGFTETITIGDVLSHRSGLGDHDGDELWFFGDLKNEVELVVEKLKYLPARKPPLRKFMYSNINFEVATVCLEKLAGQPWHQFLRKTILGPLDMSDTYMSLQEIPKTKVERIAHGHWFSLHGTENEPHIDVFQMLDPSTPSLFKSVPGGYLGAGSMISSVRDFCKWMAFLLDPTGSTIFKNPDSIYELQRAQMLVDDPWVNVFMSYNVSTRGNAYGSGYGFDLVGTLFQGRRFFAKGGDSLMHKSRNGMLPEENLGVIVLCNIVNNPMAEPVLNSIRNILLDVYGFGTDVKTAYHRWWTNNGHNQVTNIAKEMRSYATKFLVLPSPIGKVKVPYQCGRMSCSLDWHTIDSISRNTYSTPTTMRMTMDGENKLTKLAGIFVHPYFGALEVKHTHAQDQLHVHYGRIDGPLIHHASRGNNTISFYCPQATRISLDGQPLLELSYNTVQDVWMTKFASFSRDKYASTA